MKKKYISQSNNSVTTSSVLNNIQYFTNNIIWTKLKAKLTNIIRGKSEEIQRWVFFFC